METKKRTARILVERLSSASPETRTAALAELRLISKHDPESRPLIAGAGAVPCLVDALYTGGADQENAAAALLNLSISSRHLLISAPGLLDGISDLLLRHRHPTPRRRPPPSSPPPPPFTASSSRRPTGPSSARSATSSSPSSTSRVESAIRAGAVAGEQGGDGGDGGGGGSVRGGGEFGESRGVGVLEDATAVAAQVAGCRESAEAFGRAGGGGDGGLGGVWSGGGRGGGRARENAVAGMLNLARWGGAEAAEEVRRACLEGGVLEGVMEVAVSGSGKGRGKARELLAILNNDRRHGGDGGDDGDDSLGNVRFDFVLDHDYHDVVVVFGCVLLLLWGSLSIYALLVT
ncbi:hypothetical protein Syun_017791 [Stephania yunnanensis]|uniref:Uncharacterized protein n=1 Tax=Stephania yunnanensis TaxID=152371 RepID=A0AAP0P3Q2_9MAGN